MVRQSIAGTIQNRAVNLQNFFYRFGLQDLLLSTALYNPKVNSYIEMRHFLVSKGISIV